MNFELDPFQKKAVHEIEKGHSVLVSAPTGSGKTLIAERAIDKALSEWKDVIYTAPIKALSNQKYRDFRARYGDDKVGILTGDVSINPEAPILIMTTEIYRNSLFASSERIQKVGWVIFDEIHYLDDPERGTVWEEALLFTPSSIKILALSATIPNIQKLAEWIRTVHGNPLEVVQESHRPVPLHFLFHCQNKLFDSLKQLKAEGYWNRDSWRLSRREKRHGMSLKPRPNRLEDLLKHLLDKNRLPVIYFAFGRQRTENLAWDTMHLDLLTSGERADILRLYDSLIVRYDLQDEPSAQDLRELITQGIAFHHAGMLPSLKEIVEQLFTSRLIKLIFTTETFALGINMPARSVVFDELEKFYGTGFRALTNRDFYQMAGRAGRRGLDHEGFVYIRLDPRDIAHSEVQRILQGQAEPVLSQLNAAYATLLHLYRDLGSRLLDLYPKTFHYFQSSERGQAEGLRLFKDKLALLKDLHYLNEEGLTLKGEFASAVFGYELLLAEMLSSGFLDELNEAGLTVLLSGLVYEPRKNDQDLKRLHGENERIRRKAEETYRHIHKKESQFRIRPFTKEPCLNLAEAARAWSHGEAFGKVISMTNTDEGELVRHFRMVIQLLRELMYAPHTSQALRKTAEKAKYKINRDVVDAERQLRA